MNGALSRPAAYSQTYARPLTALQGEKRRAGEELNAKPRCRQVAVSHSAFSVPECGSMIFAQRRSARLAQAPVHGMPQGNACYRAERPLPTAGEGRCKQRHGPEVVGRCHGEFTMSSVSHFSWIQSLAIGPLAAMSFSLVWPATAQDRSIDPEIVAVQVRSQGFVCTNPSSAERVDAESTPDEPVYVLKCEGRSYRVRLIPHRAANVSEIIE